MRKSEDFLQKLGINNEKEPEPEPGPFGGRHRSHSRNSEEHIFSGRGDRHRLDPEINHSSSSIFSRSSMEEPTRINSVSNDIFGNAEVALNMLSSMGGESSSRGSDIDLRGSTNKGPPSSELLTPGKTTHTVFNGDWL